MTAILATFSDFKLVKTRKVAQLVLEVPLEKADEALKALGGLPRPDDEKWVGIAPLDKTAVAVRPADGGAPHAPVKTGDKPGPKPFRSLPRSQQAAIKCGDKPFRLWLGVTPHDGFWNSPAVEIDTDNALKRRLGIASKRELDTDLEAGARWDTLLAQFEADNGLMAERR